MSHDNGQSVRMHSAYQKSNASTVAGDLSDVMHDITQLAELQAKLFTADSKAVLRRATLPAVAMLIGTCVTLGCIPIALLAGAEFIQTQADIPRSIALTCSVVAGLIIAATLLTVGWSRLRGSLGEFDRSRVELSQNIAWVKHTLRRDGRSRHFTRKKETVA